MNGSDNSGALWVCPWGSCNEQQAQECRAIKTHKGCGGLFRAGTTLEQAKQQIAPRAQPACGCGKCYPMNYADPASIRMIVCPVCGDKRCVHAKDHAAPCAMSNIYEHNLFVERSAQPPHSSGQDQDARDAARWVSVDERLPEKFTEVLIAFAGQIAIAATGQYTASVHDKHGWSYPSENNGTCDDGSDPIVTHWMPLPDAPAAMAQPKDTP
jgi:hypothetical protein